MGKKIISAALALLMLMFAVPTTVFAAAVSELPSVEEALGQSVSASDVVIDADAKKAEVPASAEKTADEPETETAEEPADEPETETAEEPADEPADLPEAPAADGGESLKATVYNVKVDGQQFDSSKLTISCGSGTATLDPTTTPYTLTLNNANITVYSVYGQTCNAIESGVSLKIKIVGKNKINISRTDDVYSVQGIYVYNGDLEIIGTGELDIRVNSGTSNPVGIRSYNGKVTLGAYYIYTGVKSGMETAGNAFGVAANSIVINPGQVVSSAPGKAFSVDPTIKSGTTNTVWVSNTLNSGALEWNGVAPLGGGSSSFRYVNIKSAISYQSVELYGWQPLVTNVSTQELGQYRVSSTANYRIDSIQLYNDSTKTLSSLSSSSYLSAGTKYSYVITVVPNQGYAFANNATIRIDNVETNVDASKSTKSSEKCVVYTALMTPQTAITYLDYKGYTAPFDGVKWEDTLANIVPNDVDNATISEKYWYNDTKGDRMEAGESFVSGNRYSLCVVFKAKSGYAFRNTTQKYINGSTKDVDATVGGYIPSKDAFAIWSKPVTAAAPVYVNGTALTEKNNTLACGSGTATLNINTTPATLTLDNASITSAYTFGIEHCGILAHIPLKIMISGANTIQVSGTQFYQTGIYCTDGDLTIDGGGTLDIKANSSSGIAHGIETYEGNITVNGGTLQIEAIGASGENSFGLRCDSFANNTAPHINGGEVMIGSSNKAVNIKPVVASSMVVWTGNNTYGTNIAAWDKSTALTTYKWLGFERNNKTTLTEVGISGFHPPVAGETAGENLASVKPTDPAKYSLASYTTTMGTTRAIYWVDATADKAMQDTDKFVSGRTYYIAAHVKAGAGYSLAAATKGKVNSETKYYDDIYSQYRSTYDRFALFSTDIVCSKAARLAGSTRTSTAAAISSTAFTSSKYVIIASGDNYADALAGVSLAGALNAPILLVVKAYGLDAATKAEIKRLGATNAIILGGTGAIPDTVANSLKNDCGCAVERIKGATRYGTAVAIAKYMDNMRGKTAGSVFFVYAANYPDALAVSSVAASKNAPILYMDKPGKLDADTLAYMQKLGARPFIYIIGGTGVISADAEKELKSFDNDGNVKRVYGSDRYQTCLKINQDPEFKTCFDGENLCVATALSFPDALAGGVLCARLKAPLVLVPKTSSGSNEQYFTPQHNYIKSYDPTNVYIFGGEAAVGKDIEDLLAK